MNHAGAVEPALLEYGFDALLLTRPFRDKTGEIVDLEIVDLNRNAELLLRHDKADLIGALLCERFPENRTRDTIALYLDTALTGQVHQLTFRGTNPAVARTWLRVRSSRSGSFVVIAMNDISDAITEQLAHQEGEARFEIAFESAAIGMALVGLSGHWLEVNEALLEMLGYTREELLKLDFQQITHPDDLLEDLRLTQRLLAGELESFRLEKRYLHKSGHHVWTELSVALTRETDGAASAFITHIQDISERKRIESKLQESEERLKLALEAAEMGWWEWDVVNDLHRWSDGFARLIGYDPSEEKGDIAAFLACVHPDDREKLSNMTYDPLQWLNEIDYRVLLPDGTERWVSSRSKTIWDDHGALIRIIGVDVDISQRKYAEQDLLQRATHDSLTDLPNRRLFSDNLEQAISVARRSDSQLAVGFLDLDRFKLVNDSFGHAAGDALLQQVAARLKSCLRHDDIVARLGGDEFTMILHAVRSTDNGAVVAEKILEVFKTPFLLDGQELTINASMGISLFPGDGPDAQSLLRHADDAKRRAKQSGRGNYQFYRSEMTRVAQEQLELERDLRRGLEQNQLFLHYQPQFELAEGRLLGVEALLRWRHPTRGFIPPSVFIPIAEESGLIAAIGEWVLHEACRQARRWREESMPPFRIAINVSALQFERHDLVEDVRAALQKYDLEARWLELELTESLVMRDVEDSTRQLERLRALGVQVAVDDFGTGYSSLAYLQRLPIDRLKIDRTFVKDLGGEHDTMPLVQAVIGLAHTLGMEVVAEGIETNEQLQILRQLRCEIGQGYLLGRPAPPEELLERLSESKL